jgi:hypothetical protein
LLGKDTREPTAGERQANLLAIAVPSKSPLLEEIPKEVKPLPLLDKRSHHEHVTRLLFLKNEFLLLSKDIQALDSERMRDITLQIDIFGDTTFEDRMTTAEVRNFKKLQVLAGELSVVLHEAVEVVNYLTAHVRFHKQAKAVGDTTPYISPRGEVFMAKLMYDFITYLEIAALNRQRASLPLLHATHRQWKRLLYVNVARRVSDFRRQHDIRQLTDLEHKAPSDLIIIYSAAGMNAEGAPSTKAQQFHFEAGRHSRRSKTFKKNKSTPREKESQRLVSSGSSRGARCRGERESSRQPFRA